MKYYNYILIPLICLVIHSPVHAEVIERIVAVVEKEPILQSEVSEAQSMVAGAMVSKTDILDALIDDIIIVKEVNKLGQEVTSAEIDQSVKSVMKQYHLDEAGFAKALLAQGLNLENYRIQLEKQLYRMKLVQAKVNNRIKVTKEDVASAYEKEYGGDKAKNLKVSAEYLLFKGKSSAAKKNADSVYRKIKSDNAKIVTLGNYVSGDEIVIGDFGEISRGDLLPVFDKSLFTAAEGSFTKPIETPNGYFIVHIKKRRYVEAVPLVEVENSLHNKLFELEREKEFKRYLSELRAAEFVEIKLDDKVNSR